MASKTKFVADFRAQVTMMSDCWGMIMDLVTFYNDMGWTSLDLADNFPPGGEMTADEFVAAIGICDQLFSQWTAQAAKLGKLKP
jgi:hypothetical protein